MRVETEVPHLTFSEIKVEVGLLALLGVGGRSSFSVVPTGVTGMMTPSPLGDSKSLKFPPGLQGGGVGVLCYS